MAKIFLTTDIAADMTAGSKGRADVLEILKNKGYELVYLPAYDKLGDLVRFWRQLSGKVTKNSHLVIEYPLHNRKRMYVIYLFCLLHRIKVYGVIHDIAALRFERSADQAGRDKAILNLFDGLVSHNPLMTAWLRKIGLKKKIINLNVFDYRLTSRGFFHEPALSTPLKVLYAGNLSYKKAAYIYDKQLDQLKDVQLCVYGQFFEKERINGSRIMYKGVFDPNNPALKENYHFGLIWEGTSLDTCDGEFGRYIRYNNPHKFSLYLSLGLPVIVWEEAAIAPFILSNNIGITIADLKQLENIAGDMSNEKYQELLKNVDKISIKVKNGDYLGSAIDDLIKPQYV